MPERAFVEGLWRAYVFEDCTDGLGFCKTAADTLPAA